MKHFVNVANISVGCKDTDLVHIILFLHIKPRKSFSFNRFADKNKQDEMQAYM